MLYTLTNESMTQCFYIKADNIKEAIEKSKSTEILYVWSIKKEEKTK